MVDQTAGAARLQTSDSDIHDDYMAQVKRKRLYGGALLVFFVVLLIGGFDLADARNAGGFWAGITQVFDFPEEVLSEAAGKLALLPGHLVRFLPALIETVNIAGASTLVGAMVALVFSLLSTRGLARWPRLIPVFRPRDGYYACGAGNRHCTGLDLYPWRRAGACDDRDCLSHRWRAWQTVFRGQ